MFLLKMVKCFCLKCFCWKCFCLKCFCSSNAEVLGAVHKAVYNPSYWVVNCFVDSSNTNKSKHSHYHHHHHQPVKTGGLLLRKMVQNVLYLFTLQKSLVVPHRCSNADILSWFLKKWDALGGFEFSFHKNFCIFLSGFAVSLSIERSFKEIEGWRP